MPSARGRARPSRTWVAIPFSTIHNGRPGRNAASVAHHAPILAGSASTSHSARPEGPVAPTRFAPGVPGRAWRGSPPGRTSRSRRCRCREVVRRRGPLRRPGAVRCAWPGPAGGPNRRRGRPRASRRRATRRRRSGGRAPRPRAGEERRRRGWRAARRGSDRRRRGPRRRRAAATGRATCGRARRPTTSSCSSSPRPWAGRC